MKCIINKSFLLNEECLDVSRKKSGTLYHFLEQCEKKIIKQCNEITLQIGVLTLTLNPSMGEPSMWGWGECLKFETCLSYIVRLC